jgi:hypothetical protein
MIRIDRWSLFVGGKSVSSAYIAPDSVQGIRHHLCTWLGAKNPSRPFVLQLLKLGSGSKGLSSGSKGRGGKW